MKLRYVFVSVIVLSSLAASCAPDRTIRSEKAQLAEEVRQEFLHSWNAYKEFAWGHDMLRPVSRSYVDWYKTTLLMTPLDALDTMTLMGFKEEADSVREYIVKNLSFDQDMYVKNFEITIRLLGGLLANYQLSGDRRLLAMADDLGTRLMPIFKTPTGIPYVDVNLKTGAIRNSRTNPAEAGTLLIEFGTLSKLTGKPEYYAAAKNAALQIYNRRTSIGLVGTWIDASTGTWLDSNSHVSACIDSYYEYLLKSAILFDDPEMKSAWETSRVAIMKYLADEAPSGLWIGHANMVTGRRLQPWFGLLDAFFPAVLVLSGDVGTAARLEESCFLMWNKYGIEGDQFNYMTMDTVNSRYQLNPEIMESAYYLYQATDDPRYLEMGKVFLRNLQKYCRMDKGYSGLANVATKTRTDLMESYFLAETWKYLYLLFSPPETLKFRSVVFTTEAHPIRKTW
jgi:ER degradation enhancer, mannosidase alpha-like 2